MTLTRAVGRVAPIGVLCSFLVACSDDAGSGGSDITLPHFNDLKSATKPIQTAARAVVRLHTARSFGTGSYISETGLLLTNNHVLGETVCPSEGCYVEVSTLHQRGEAKLDEETFLAVPVAFDAGQDVAVLQLLNATTLEKPSTPSYLGFDEKEAEALLGQHVTVVGHPEGNLKKWTDGTVVDAGGTWITATAYILPGDSGSPILNDAGKIVGIIHRGPSSLDLITEEGVNVYSVGTASTSIKAVLDNPQLTTLVSVDADTTEEAFLKNELFYLNARTTTVTIGATAVEGIDVIGKACDAGLNRTDFASLDELDEALAPCYQAITWIDCRFDAQPTPNSVVCPSETEQVNWRNRFQSANGLEMAMNGIANYYLGAAAVSRLETSYEAGVAAGATAMQQLLTASAPNLDFELAYYLAAFGIATYDGKSVSDFVSGYSKVPSYELSAEYIAYAASYLTGSQAFTPDKLYKLLKGLESDPKVAIGAKLSIEDYLYELGQL